MKVRVRMTVPADHSGVHDGAGGVHKSGTSPCLEEGVAKQFVDKKLAVYVDAWPKRWARKAWNGWFNLEYREKLATIALIVAIVAVVVRQHGNS